MFVPVTHRFASERARGGREGQRMRGTSMRGRLHPGVNSRGRGGDRGRGFGRGFSRGGRGGRGGRPGLRGT